MTAVVVDLDDCTPVEQAGGGAVVRSTLDASRGCPRLVQRVVRVEPGRTLEGTAERGGELWYVVAGRGRLQAGEGTGVLAAGVGILLASGSDYALEVSDPGPLELVQVVLPEGAPQPPGGAPVFSLLDECEVEVTGDRRFRVLIGPEQGCDATTQFVGEIPPGRAPAHTHTYDEVVLVLEGHGIVHLEGEERPITAGTCVYLPPGSLHCLENTGEGELRVLGVFHPGGSPAAKREVGAT